MQYGIEEISRAIARKGPPGSVGTMRAGSQAEGQNARMRITERGHRAPPVLPIGIGATPHPRDFSAMCSQTRTAFASDDPRVQNFK